MRTHAVDLRPWRGVDGVVDVTTAPFNADPTGETDATGALQSAISYALSERVTVFLPLGVYRVTDTLNLTCYNRSNDAIVVGETLGSRAANVARLRTVAPVVYPQLEPFHQHSRPVLFLPPKTAGYGDPEHPRYLVFFLRIAERVGQWADKVRLHACKQSHAACRATHSCSARHQWAHASTRRSHCMAGSTRRRTRISHKHIDHSLEIANYFEQPQNSCQNRRFDVASPRCSTRWMYCWTRTHSTHSTHSS